jgi:hypothetical protein
MGNRCSTDSSQDTNDSYQYIKKQKHVRFAESNKCSKRLKNLNRARDQYIKYAEQTMRSPDQSKIDQSKIDPSEIDSSDITGLITMKIQIDILKHHYITKCKCGCAKY